MKTTSRLAMVAAAGLLLGGYALPANAADLGGDCCADLEERVAELEATTARKGNRKVSLEVSGQVNRALLVWDDGIDSDAYVVDNDLSSTRFRFTGSAVMKPGWKAGFLIEIEVQDTASNTVDAFDDEGSGEADPLLIRHSNWYIESERYGRVTVGHGSFATDDLVLISLANTGQVATPDVALWHQSFDARTSGGDTLSGLTWGNLYTGMDTARGDLVRYDSPAIYGFILSAAWGEDDVWDIALRFQKEWNSIRIAAGIGYLWDGDDNAGGQDFEEIKGSASIMHVPTGLYLNFAAGERRDQVDANLGDDIDADDAFYWFVQAGIQKRFLPYGATTIFAQYGQYDDFAVGLSGAGLGANVDNDGSGDDVVSGSEVEHFGVGIVQTFDSAALDLYLFYMHNEAEVNVSDNFPDTGSEKVDLEDWDSVVVGARIKF